MYPRLCLGKAFCSQRIIPVVLYSHFVSSLACHMYCNFFSRIYKKYIRQNCASTKEHWQYSRWWCYQKNLKLRPYTQSHFTRQRHFSGALLSTYVALSTYNFRKYHNDQEDFELNPSPGCIEPDNTIPSKLGRVETFSICFIFKPQFLLYQRYQLIKTKRQLPRVPEVRMNNETMIKNKKIKKCPARIYTKIKWLRI